MLFSISKQAKYEDPEVRADWVSWALDEEYLPFLYADTESDDSQVRITTL